MSIPGSDERNDDFGRLYMVLLRQLLTRLSSPHHIVMVQREKSRGGTTRTAVSVSSRLGIA